MAGRERTSVEPRIWLRNPQAERRQSRSAPTRPQSRIGTVRRRRPGYPSSVEQGGGDGAQRRRHHHRRPEQYGPYDDPWRRAVPAPQQPATPDVDGRPDPADDSDQRGRHVPGAPLVRPGEQASRAEREHPRRAVAVHCGRARRARTAGSRRRGRLSSMATNRRTGATHRSPTPRPRCHRHRSSAGSGSAGLLRRPGPAARPALSAGAVRSRASVRPGRGVVVGTARTHPRRDYLAPRP